MDLTQAECHLRSLRNDVLSLLKNTIPNKKKDFEVISSAQDAIDRIYMLITAINEKKNNGEN